MNFINVVYMIMFFFGIYLVSFFVLLHYRNGKRLFDSSEPNRYPSLSIIVPAYNEEKSIAKTLIALLKLEYFGKKEIIVVNDGSKDDTLKIARGFAKKNKEIIVLDKKNSGKADSLNYTIKRAKGELMAVVDADSYPEKDALLKMVGFFEEKNVAAVTSRVLVKNKDNWLEKYQVADYSIIAWTRKLLDFVNSVYVTNGPLSIYRKKVIEKVGGFDSKNLTEDIEITWNLLSKGYQTRMAYSAVVYTSVPANLNGWIKQRVRWNLGGLQTMKKYQKNIFRNPENTFGYFVIPYVALSFFFAMVGIILLVRYLWIKGAFYFYSFFYSLRGYNFFRYLDINIQLTIILIFSFIFLLISLVYYKTGFANSQMKKSSLMKILNYTIIYRSLYIIPLLLAFYKIIRGDIGWYTK